MEGKSKRVDRGVEQEDIVSDQIDPTLSKDHKESANDEAERVEYFCGFGRCRPKCLQVFRSAYFFTFLICCDIFIEGALATGFLSLTLTTIQRRYELNSTQSGLIVSVFDMAVIVSVIFVSYFGGKGHKPRWLGVGLLVQGLGSLIFALPEFVFGTYSVSTRNSRTDVCNGLSLQQMISPLGPANNATDATQCNVDTSDRYSLIFFFIGNMLIGLGATPLFTIGPSYVDDIVKPKYVSFHLGFFYAFAILGPALGFGIGAGFLNIYVDFWEETSLELTDPAYVGAWWLCFLFGCVVSWIVAIPFLMFPRLLPDSHLVKEERQKQMAQTYQASIEEENSSLLNNLLSLPRHFCQIFTTLTWVFITIAVSFSAFVITGVSVFTPSYYQAQFNLTAATASIVTGAVSIPTGFVGVIIGGLLVFLSKSDGRRVTLINTIVTVITMPPLLVYLIRCPTLEIAGVTRPFAEDQFLIAEPVDPINASCSRSCDCNFQSNVYQPVCGGDGLTYTSPCRAGCSVTFEVRAQKQAVYENCTCIADNLRETSSSTSRNYSNEDIVGMSVASEGACDDGCNSFVIHVIVSVIALLLLFVLAVPNVFITIRCVADEQRTLALGMQSFLFRLFGNIPGPIVFGAVFDISCVFRNYTFPCGSTEAAGGACWIYNNIQLSNAILAMALIAIGMNVIFSLLAWIFYKKKKSSENPSEDTNDVVLPDRNTS